MTCACLCWCTCMWRYGGVVSAVWVRGFSGGGPLQLQDVWVRLLQVVKGAEEASLNARHVPLREVGVALGGDVWARPQQRHEAGCHHVRAELYGGGTRVAGFSAVRGGLPLLGAQPDLPQPPVCGDPPDPLGPPGKAIHSSTKALVAAADGEQRVQGLAFLTCPRGGNCPARPPWCTCRGLGCVCGGGSWRGGGSRCRVPASGQLVRGSGWWRGCSADCT